MRYVELDPVMNPEPYLKALASMEGELPAGALAFASDEGHYDFNGLRCVKDLTVGSLTLSDNGHLDIAAHFDPNQWKHDATLTITYTQVTSFAVTANDSTPIGPKRLGSIMLDEVLPHAHGVSHEIAFHGGTIAVVCRDLTAAWAALN